MLVKDLSIEKILVVYKKARYDIMMEHQDDKTTKEYLQNQENVKQLLESRDAQNNMTDRVVTDLQKAGFGITVKYRGELNAGLIDQHDCVVTTGGDGTLLETNSYSTSVPILAINTDKRKVRMNEFDSSEGFYCAMSQQEYDERFKKFLDGEMGVVPMMRFEAKLNGVPVRNRNNGLVHRVLNEISVGGKNSHSSSNYLVRVGDYEEYQACSGILIATPQDSWPYWELKDYKEEDILDVDGRAFHLIARGLGPKQCHPEKKTSRFIIENLDSVQIVSKNPRTSLGFDGDYPDTLHKFGLDSVLEVRKSEHPAQIIGFDKEKRLWYLKKENMPITRRF